MSKTTKIYKGQLVILIQPTDEALTFSRSGNKC